MTFLVFLKNVVIAVGFNSKNVLKESCVAVIHFVFLLDAELL